MKSNPKAIVGHSFVDVPEPQPFTPVAPPYPFEPIPDTTHPLYQGWFKMCLARYVIQCQKKAFIAENENEFIALCSVLERDIFNNKLWLEYACTNKRKAIKKIEAKDNVKPKPLKRSDAMRLLLEEEGYRVRGVDDVVLDARGNKLGIFLTNGKIDLPSGERVSTYDFIKS